MNSRRLSLAVLIVAAMLMSDGNASAEQGKHLFILSGQSNMRGDLPYAFKDAVVGVFGEDKVLVATHARPSAPIRSWYKDWKPPEGVTVPQTKSANGQIYDELIAQVKRSINGKQLASVTYIWMQGEADAESGWAGVYEKSFFGVLDQIKKDIGVKDINFVVGRINDYYLTNPRIKQGKEMRELQVRLGETHANGAWVDTDDLNTGVNPWGVFSLADGHFPPAGYRVMGQRFAREACKLIDPAIKLDERLFDARVFDKASDIKRHAAMGKQISGTKPDAKYNGGDAGLASLLDGKYASANHEDKAWLGFAPGVEGVELLIDLGEQTLVTDIAANLLLSNKAAGAFPKSATYSISEDGKVFRIVNERAIRFFYDRGEAKKLIKELEPQPVLVLVTLNKQASVRYIRVKLEADESWLFVDEIVVNPAAK